MLISSDAWTHLAWCIGLILVHLVLACTVFRPMTWCACYIEYINFDILFIHCITSIPIHILQWHNCAMFGFSKRRFSYTKKVKNNTGKKKRRLGVILTPFSSSKCLLVNCLKSFSGWWLAFMKYAKVTQNVLLKLSQTGHLENVSSSISKHYKDEHSTVPKDLNKQFSVLKKCNNKFSAQNVAI